MPYRNRNRSSISKYFRRSSTYFKGVRRTGRRARSNRIFRKFIRRTAVRPELKWSNIIVSGQVGLSTGSTAPVVTQNLTPLVIGQGTGIGSRIGDQLSFVKIDVRLRLRDASGNIVATAPQQDSYLLRYVIWSCRADSTLCFNYMNGIATTTNLDYNVVTKIYDRTVQLAPAYVQEATTADANHGAITERFFTHKFKFPRKVKFTGNAVTSVDEEKYSCYITFVGSSTLGTGTTYSYESKTWFFDS